LPDGGGWVHHQTSGESPVGKLNRVVLLWKTKEDYK
jgi:hypothetical protein